MRCYTKKLFLKRYSSRLAASLKRHSNTDVFWTVVQIFRNSYFEEHLSTIKSNLQHEWQTRTTRVPHERQECIRANDSDTSATRTTRTTRVWQEWKSFDFDNYTSENIFSHPYIYYMANERSQEKKQFHSKSYLWKWPIPMPKCVWKCAAKTEFCNDKSYIKRLYTKLKLQMPLHVPI